MANTDLIDKGFGPVHIVEPQAGHPHTHTAILLHGRGSTGEDFAEELFETCLSYLDEQRLTLAESLPTWRWVFPSSPSTWNAVFEEYIPAWFEAHSLADPTLRQDLQPPGLVASVQHVEQIMDEETRTLREAGHTSDARARLVLGGVSLGGAVALWALLGTKQPEQPLGGFTIASTWLPFAKEVETYFIRGQAREKNESEGSSFVQSTVAPLGRHLQQRRQDQDQDQDQKTQSATSTPIFVGHGRDDAYVDIELGRQVEHVLDSVGFIVQWHEYEGAEQEGHWLKEPEEMDDLRTFLDAIASWAL